MVRVDIKGWFTTYKTLQSGERREYHYHRVTLRRLNGKPGSPEFIADYANRRKAHSGSPWRRFGARGCRPPSCTDSSKSDRRSNLCASAPAISVLECLMLSPEVRRMHCDRRIVHRFNSSDFNAFHTLD